jgi:hypothetical protein
MKTTLSAAILVLALAGNASADRADDDLQAVRRAVASSPAAASPVEEPPPASGAQPRVAGAEARWFKVRIVEKAGKKARVSVNLPLGLVRSLGDDWPIGPSDRRRRPTLGEVLRALDSGQSLVEIDDEETTVCVWVE